MREKFLYHKRKFISPDRNSDAFVSARISNWHDEISGTVKIADCYRRINLEVNGWNKRDLKNTIKKFENLRDVLDEVIETLQKEQ